MICDKTGKIIDKRYSQIGKISIYHKENGGLSDARNIGIQQAQGEYITFIDSDDTIKNGTLSALLNVLEKYPKTDILENRIFERFGHITREHLLSF